jgi:hypothetical protein
MVFNNWHEFFLSCMGNEDLMAWAQETAIDMKLFMLTNDASTAILAVDTNNNIIIVHSFTNFSGSVLYPANRFGALIRNGRNASPVIVNKASLFRAANVATPCIHNILGCTDKAEFEAIQCPAQCAPKNYRGSTSFLPAPWLLKAVSGVNTPSERGCK